MNTKFTDYRQFRDLVSAKITLISGRTATISTETPDPTCAFARNTNVDFGIRLTLPRQGRADVHHILWVDKDGKAMERQSLLATRMVDAALMRLPSVVENLEPVERELCDYLASNGHPKTYAELLDMARYFAKNQ